MSFVAKNVTREDGFSVSKTTAVAGLWWWWLSMTYELWWCALTEECTS